jgi:hypothetical protein
LAQLITRYILGDGAKVQFTQVTSSTREQVLINDQVDMVFATYSITPARAEKIAFAGPYYTSQAGVLVKSNNKAIQSYNDLAGKKVATQAGSTGPAILAQFAPKAVVQEFQTHQEALDGLRQGRVDAYVTDYTLLLNALSLRHRRRAVGRRTLWCAGPLRHRIAQGLGRRGLHQCLPEEGGSRRHLGQTLDHLHRAAHRQHRRSDAARSPLTDGRGFKASGRLRACLRAGPFVDLEAHRAVVFAWLPAGRGRDGASALPVAAAALRLDGLR